ncbi:hypothetical protein DERF_006152 [Dermatophagoides farinae]|uniref:Uncharacterized protein n=1 Tax=Dermatophagoides farinae TaxID=6954 RepID=A0A922IB21_DERFA|nr:hypothetical protein DERF_006152 [Dermatophagoides farinae]
MTNNIYTSSIHQLYIYSKYDNIQEEEEEEKIFWATPKSTLEYQNNIYNNVMQLEIQAEFLPENQNE